MRLLGAEPFDGVLMDMQMPDVDGLDVTRWIRSTDALAQLPVIAMTANARSEDLQRCLAAGMNDFATKPVDAGVLYATLAKWVRPPAAGAGPRQTAAVEGAAVRHEVMGRD
jgi:CheY-like chemotaxis protein